MITLTLASASLSAQPAQEPRARSGDPSVDYLKGSGESCVLITQVERDAKVALHTGKRNRARTLAEKAVKRWTD
jgi:hypothetical protein